MSGSVQTTYDSLCKLVRWAHSHGTICNLIPSLQRLTHGSYGNMLTPEPDLHGSSTPVTVWGCGAGHAYHWPISDHSNSCVASANISQRQESFVGGCPSNKIGGRASWDLSCTEATSDGEEFNSRLLDIAGCDLSARDVNGDYEQRPSRKRVGIPAGAVMWKKVKQEATSAEHYETVSYVANSPCTGPAVIDSGACQAPYTHTPLLNKPIPPCLQPQQHNAAQREHQHDLGCEESDDPEMELLKRGSSTTGTTDRADRCGSATETTEKTAAAGGQNKLEKLRALLCAERSHNRQMLEMISSLKQDKELLQQELTKKAELICDFLRDKLRPDTSWAHCSIQMEPGSSHLTSSDDVGRFDPSFYTFEEMELHPLEYHRALKTKRSRDGENTRVRMKNVVGVIARYMAALQEFRCSVSMKVAFDRVGVDRNTISRTAAIAELSLAAPEVFNGLAPWDEKEETLAHYAQRCRQAMDDTIKAKIKMMKAKGELLPIVSK